MDDANYPSDIRNIKGLVFQAPDPYPECKVTKPNSRNLIPLSQDYAAQCSEMTAINQYIFQSTLLRSECPNLAQCLNKIAIVEMHHLSMLGQLITEIGGYPRAVSLQSGHTVPWNGFMPNYARNVRQILMVNIQSEQDAIRHYQMHIRTIGDPDICKVIERILLDEELHVKLFEQFIKELS